MVSILKGLIPLRHNLAVILERYDHTAVWVELTVILLSDGNRAVDRKIGEIAYTLSGRKV